MRANGFSSASDRVAPSDGAGPLAPICVRVAEYGVASGDAILATMGLGSCVAIILHDASMRIGGLAHILLPTPAMSRDRGNRAKFPGTAVPLLVSAMRAAGSDGRLTAKLVGGASMFGSLLPVGGITIGQRNLDATRRALVTAGIPIIAQDVGEDYGRSAFLSVADGRVVVKSLAHGERIL
jgi:chemotaxis protein CheD